MIDNKLFSTANGRLFRIQATSRRTGKTQVLERNLTEADVRRFEPSKTEKQLYRYFKVAFNDSKE